MPDFTPRLSQLSPLRAGSFLLARRVVALLAVSLLAACATPSAPVPTPSSGKTPVVIQKPAARSTTEKPAAPALAEPVVQIAPLDVGAPTDEATPSPDASRTGQEKPLAQGLASWYGQRFHGRRTASGERFDMHALTAAHKTLPFGTRLRVRSVHTGKEVVVRINDRGPYKNNRIIDLSLGAITALGLRHRGVTEVILLRE